MLITLIVSIRNSVRDFITTIIILALVEVFTVEKVEANQVLIHVIDQLFLHRQRKLVSWISP